jgi:2-keto-4-pentenoate hydratase/2-oxohepta-3-ene-1,7-dioic acid hydratase in catechol pathway
MKIVGFEAEGQTRLGVVEDSTVIDLKVADEKAPGDVREWLARNGGDLAPLADLARRAPAGARRPLEGLKYALPVARPGKIICLGLNYMAHVKEGRYANEPPPQYPSVFLRCQTSLVAHEAPIVRPRASDSLDYEAELVVVIGRGGKHIAKEKAYDHVAGYSVFNEGSVREFQRRTTQWDMGKNFDRTGGFGPWMVTADEVPPGGKGLKIETRLNGTVMQSDNTENMMFPVAETIAYVSQGMTLEPGDVIVMGTPSGVGGARKPPVWMKNGDTCEVEIERVGLLRNPIQDE